MLGVFNSNATTKFVQLHYFITKYWGAQKILYAPCPQAGGNVTETQFLVYQRRAYREVTGAKANLIFAHC